MKGDLYLADRFYCKIMVTIGDNDEDDFLLYPEYYMFCLRDKICRNQSHYIIASMCLGGCLTKEIYIDGVLIGHVAISVPL